MTYDSVAKLDIASDYESEGRGFESLLGHQKRTAVNGDKTESSTRFCFLIENIYNIL